MSMLIPATPAGTPLHAGRLVKEVGCPEPPGIVASGHQ